MKYQKRKLGLLISSIVIVSLLMGYIHIDTYAEESKKSVTLLFTTDIHSSDVPHLAMKDGKGMRLGGFARLKTEADRQYREGETLLLDSGDFTMGTLYQNYSQSDALELTIMDDIGYDAIALKYVYNVLGYGISPLDGSSGAPICTFYLNGQELYDVCETSVSPSGMMNTVQMLLGGMHFHYSDTRLPLNRVYQVEILNRETGTYDSVIRDTSTLYKVAVSWTAMQNLSLLGSKSFGLLNVIPKDENGVPKHLHASNKIIAKRIK